MMVRLLPVALLAALFTSALIGRAVARPVLGATAAQGRGVWAPVRPAPPSCTASWYGEAHRGLLTASGVPFDPDGLTAASWDHDFGTVLEVTAVESGRTVHVEVTDRGPARRLERCVDLSAAAFARLVPLGVGLVEVSVEASVSDDRRTTPFDAGVAADDSTRTSSGGGADR